MIRHNPRAATFVLVFVWGSLCSSPAAAGPCKDIPVRVTLHSNAVVDALTGATAPAAIQSDGAGEYINGASASALINRIREEIRRAGRRPQAAALESQTADAGPSPLEEAIGQEAVERYESALSRLRPEDRQAIIGRIELGLTNEELADALGKPTPNAARMAVERALLRLAKEMRHGSKDT